MPLDSQSLTIFTKNCILDLEEGKYFFSLFIAYCIVHFFNKKLIYKKLELAWFKTQEASRAVITFLTKFSYVEN